MLSFNLGGTEGYEESVAEQAVPELEELPWKWDTTSVVDLPSSSSQTQSQMGAGLDDTLAFASDSSTLFNNDYGYADATENGQISSSPVYLNNDNDNNDDWAAALG